MAKQSIRLMTDFHLQVEAWLRDGRARTYFGERDGDAIAPLDKVLAALPPLDRMVT